MSRPIRIVHVITGLGVGGAELMLFNLLAVTGRDIFAPAVISLTGNGPVGERIAALGIPVHVLGMRRDRPEPFHWWLLGRLLKRSCPDLVQTWMYHADLLGGMAARAFTAAPVVWGLHNTNLEPGAARATTRAVAWACARVSGVVPRRIISCSQAAARHHAALGYPSERMIVIPNGFDLAAFRPDPAARRSVREELGLPAQALLIGSIARFHPMKDHANLVRAAGAAAMSEPNLHVLLAGSGVNTDNRMLMDWISATGVPQRFHLLGQRADMPRIQAALDLAVSASAWGEAFPLVVGEAMACGVPCIATRVGDTALMIGDTGVTVSPRDSEALATAISDLARTTPERRAALGAAARHRVRSEYAVETIAGRYRQLYESILTRSAG